MRLEDIGFYTLSDERAMSASGTSPMWRCELILTDKCNFNCPYCRGLRPDCHGDMPMARAEYVIRQWIQDGLQHIRFSGGEPTLYKGLADLVYQCRRGRVKRIAVSTNGSATFETYRKLVESGVNDFSISLDACCASVGEAMAGVCGQYKQVVESIRELSKITYVTVGIVLTNNNINTVSSIVDFAHELGVADIRIITAAQEKTTAEKWDFSVGILDKHPILKYRMDNLEQGKPMRGLTKNDAHKCNLLRDDSVVAGEWHFPCVIYLREGGEPIGKIGKNMREQRLDWIKQTDTHSDPICKRNCLDVCVDFNNKALKLSIPK
jgi:molybdenum cofactor biosynthesis enzyme MoaA